MVYKADPNDIVITIVGPTGSGKTRFIEALSGRGLAGGASSLKTNNTKSVTPHIIQYNGLPQLSGRLVLVDTPGLQDGSLDATLLRDIYDELQAKYSRPGVTLKLAGVIYLHRITDDRLQSSPIFQKPHLLGRFCLNTSLSHARLVTTMWNELRHKEVGEDRERELKEYWRPLINQGAATKRFDNTPDAAREIIADLLRQIGQGSQQNAPGVEGRSVEADGVCCCVCC